MTAPQIDISGIIPTKWKPWVGALGAILTFVVPTVTEVAAGLPQPWPVLIAGVIAALTWLGIYKVPYVPTGAVLVPESVIAHDGGVEVVIPPSSGGYQSPWPK